MNKLMVQFVGAHLSIKGSYVYLFEQAEKLQIKTIACFTASNLRYEYKDIIDPIILAEFLKYKKLHDYTIFSHAAYLINIANKDNIEIYQKSVRALTAELRRCHQLEITGVAFHPGSHRDMEVGIRTVAETINELAGLVDGETQLLIESSAGQGHTLPTNFSEIALLDSLLSSKIRKKVGFVFDTCHIFAAGYDLSSRDAVYKTLELYDREIGLERVKLIHLNDSKKNCGERIDRHETVGRGFIGKEGMIAFLNHPRIKDIPKILETPISNYIEWKKELDWINSILL